VLEPPASGDIELVVQDKYASGPMFLGEDPKPAYLSTRPVPRCADETINCTVPGTELHSGDRLVAECVVAGDEMTNADLTSEGISGNPNVATSELWYRAHEAGGPSGLISEIYVVPEQRGGMGLPSCA
jgi:hypothetical protein